MKDSGSSKDTTHLLEDGASASRITPKTQRVRSKEKEANSREGDTWWQGNRGDVKIIVVKHPAVVCV